MIEKILKIKNETTFDFRKFAYPDDELSYLFDRWVDYYRLKYAICKAIEPKSILEVGVRYGYSAITFLCAAKDASYTGIDNDSDISGGQVGAVSWAKKITRGFKAEFMIEDTQRLESFPGGPYDLIHIDGQQDGDGTFHDLELAFEKGAYILLDGYFWSRFNMLSATFFLEKYRDFVEYFWGFPGYAGELLIKTNGKAKGIRNKSAKNYRVLQGSYDADYYLNNCGGYDSFIESGGLELSDPRILTVYCLSDAKKGQSVLDIGCGRGELSYAIAKRGARVVGIDYSEDAVNIAKRTYIKEMNDSGRLEFVKGDLMEYEFSEKFDTVIAADLVEHIEQESLEKMLERISARLLKETGRLIIHTAPNKLNYRYDYARRRERAKELGLYLPKNPRTYYEDLMHINEQTPAMLKRTLKKHFRYSLTWVSALPDAVGSLDRKNFNKSYFSSAISIFAVASNSSIDRERVISLISQQKLKPSDLAATPVLNWILRIKPSSNAGIRITSELKNIELRASETTVIKVLIENKTRKGFITLFPYPVQISYHWINEDKKVEVFDGLRTPIRERLEPSQRREFIVQVQAPEKKGRYTLAVTLVQENNFWFEKVLPRMPLRIDVVVL